MHNNLFILINIVVVLIILLFVIILLRVNKKCGENYEDEFKLVLYPQHINCESTPLTYMGPSIEDRKLDFILRSEATWTLWMQPKYNSRYVVSSVKPIRAVDMYIPGTAIGSNALKFESTSGYRYVLTCTTVPTLNSVMGRMLDYTRKGGVVYLYKD